MKNLTNHAQTRIQQRGIPSETVALVLRHGTAKHAGQHGKSYYMDKQARKRAEKSPDRDLYRKYADRLNIYIIVAYDGDVVTVAHSYHGKPHRRKKPRWNHCR